MNRMILIVVLTIFSLAFALCQGVDYSEILGEWKSVKIEPESKTDEEILSINIGGTKSQSHWQIKLFQNGRGFNVNTNDFFEYKIEANSLTIGDQKYRIEKLTDKELVLLEIDKKVNIAIYRYFFSRVSKDEG